MRSIKILDCTLRDGGFINDWQFGHGSIRSIVSRLNQAKIDIIELGFIDQRRAYDAERSILPDTESFKPILAELKGRSSLMVGMIDFGTCDLSKISDQKDSPFDGLRVIFKKKDRLAALEYCKQLIDKGYKVSVQPVSTTGYTDDELVDLLKRIDLIKPFSVAIVDTYGLMHKKELFHYFSLFDAHLSPEVYVGYHSHNNFQLAYANSIELAAMETERSLILDSSLYGMGKGAGNANTELLAMYLNRSVGAAYDVDQLLEAIDVDVMKEYTKKTWGYALAFYIAASNDCHPEYVKNLINKRSLSVKSINSILKHIPEANKLTYNAELLEQLFREHQDRLFEDSVSYQNLSAEVGGRAALILAPGKTIDTNKVMIKSFIQSEKPVVFSINFMPDDYEVDYVFFGNAKRYSQFFHKIHVESSPAKVIVTSNVTATASDADHVFNFGSLVCEPSVIRDNPALMLLKVLRKLGIQKVFFAGFDGYTTRGSVDYFKDYSKFLYCDDDVMLRNAAIRAQLAELGSGMDLVYLTDSVYAGGEG